MIECLGRISLLDSDLVAFRGLKIGRFSDDKYGVWDRVNLTSTNLIEEIALFNETSP